MSDVQATGELSRRTMLLAEDESLLRNILSDALRDSGYRVKEAADGAEALSILHKFDCIDLLVTDINMPGLDGYRLIGAALDFRPSLKVVMMTGYANATSPKRDHDSVIPILRKPVCIDLLVATVERLLRGGANASSSHAPTLHDYGALTTVKAA